MKEELELVEEFHKKFDLPIANVPALIDKERANFRFKVMEEEVKEYLEGVENEDLENVARELADIIYTTYGTILEHGLQDKMPEIFKEIHRANMTREFTGLKPKKGEDYVEPDLSKFL